MLRLNSVWFYWSILETAGRKRTEHILLSKLPYIHIHTYTYMYISMYIYVHFLHTHVHVFYIYIYICVMFSVP